MNKKTSDSWARREAQGALKRCDSGPPYFGKQRCTARNGPSQRRRSTLYATDHVPSRRAGAPADQTSDRRRGRSPSGHSGSYRCAAAPDFHRTFPETQPRRVSGLPSCHDSTTPESACSISVLYTVAFRHQSIKRFRLTAVIVQALRIPPSADARGLGGNVAL